MDDLRGRTTLVTGASGGIGAALAERLAGAGARLALSFNAHAEPAEQLARRLRDAGAEVTVHQADMGSADAPGRLVDAVEAELGPIEVLVPNAGLGSRKTIDEVTLADWEAAMAVNLRAPFLLIQRCLPVMRERGFGRILLLSSVAALTGGVVGPHYAASKSGLHGLLHHVASREAAHAITVNALAPALIEDTAMLPGDPGELAKRIPVGRLGTPAEVADLALAVLGNGYVSNQVLGIDGGLHPG